MPDASFPQLKELSQFLDETANIRPNPRLPWVGSGAFSHKGGAHVNAVQKVIRSYEHIDPSLVGNTRHVLVSDLAGRSNKQAKLQGLLEGEVLPELRAPLPAWMHDAQEQGMADMRSRVADDRSLGQKPVRGAVHRQPAVWRIPPLGSHLEPGAMKFSLFNSPQSR